MRRLLGSYIETKAVSSIGYLNHGLTDINVHLRFEAAMICRILQESMYTETSSYDLINKKNRDEKSGDHTEL